MERPLLYGSFRRIDRIQIGAQSVGLVLVITNEQGLRAFTGGNSFKLGADVAIAAGPVGRDTSAATDSRAKASIYSYSMSKGLFAGMTFEGSVLNQNRDANRAYWGRDMSAQAALKKPANDKRIKELVNSLNALVKEGSQIRAIRSYNGANLARLADARFDVLVYAFTSVRFALRRYHPFPALIGQASER